MVAVRTLSVRVDPRCRVVSKAADLLVGTVRQTHPDLGVARPPDGQRVRVVRDLELLQTVRTAEGKENGLLRWERVLHAFGLNDHREWCARAAAHHDLSFTSPRLIRLIHEPRVARRGTSHRQISADRGRHPRFLGCQAASVMWWFQAVCSS
jgi:hypothetical protein